MMQQNVTTLTPFYKGWDEYQGMLVQAIAPLSPEQLALRAAPSLRPAWLLAAHIIGTRVGWFQGVMGEGEPALAAFDPWDEDGAPPRTATELVDGLEATRQLLSGPPLPTRRRARWPRQSPSWRSCSARATALSWPSPVAVRASGPPTTLRACAPTGSARAGRRRARYGNPRSASRMRLCARALWRPS